MNKSKLFVFFGHHKCATGWMVGLISGVCHQIGLKYSEIHNNEQFNYDLNGYINKNNIDFLAYTNAEYEYAGNLNNFRGFHMVRDPRDITVSAYFSHLYSHSIKDWPELAAYREKIKKLSKDEGILCEMLFRKDQFESMLNWNYSQENILEIKLEHIMENSFNVFNAFEFLEIIDKRKTTTKSQFKFILWSIVNRLNKKNNYILPYFRKLDKIPASELLGIIYENRFSARSKGRKIGTENIKSHYRKGVAGDWKNHFTEQHKQYFKEHYGKLLLKLGYEKDNNW